MHKSNDRSSDLARLDLTSQLRMKMRLQSRICIYVSQVAACENLTNLSKGNDMRTSFCLGVDEVNIPRPPVVCSLFVSLIEE